MPKSAAEIVQEMYDHDLFSQWMGIKIIDVKEGYCRITMSVREEMTNGFKILHGGVTYSFADSAFAFASNSRGRHAVSIESSISHTQSVRPGDILYAEAIEKQLSHKLAIYYIAVTNEKEEEIALFRGTVYRKSKEWD